MQHRTPSASYRYCVNTAHSAAVCYRYCVNAAHSVVVCYRYCVNTAHSAAVCYRYFVNTAHSVVLCYRYCVNTAHSAAVCYRYCVNTAHCAAVCYKYDKGGKIYTEGKSKLWNALVVRLRPLGTGQCVVGVWLVPSSSGSRHTPLDTGDEVTTILPNTTDHSPNTMLSRYQSLSFHWMQIQPIYSTAHYIVFTAFCQTVDT